MSNVFFVTGNANKFYEASQICKNFDIELIQKTIDIDEIQHHDSLKIAEAKARRAYECAGEPVVVNDSSWEIPALGGFPGGYMKDVTSWLATKDFQLLMSDKDDKRIFLHEVVVYCDESSLNVFTFRRLGYFLDIPRGNSLPSFSKLVQMESDDMTISEIFDKGEWDTSSPDEYKHWYDFAKWYKEER